MINEEYDEGLIEIEKEIGRCKKDLEDYNNQLNEYRDLARYETDPRKRRSFENTIKGIEDAIRKTSDKLKDVNNKKSDLQRSEVIEIPFVILAMTRDEAFNLEKESVFDIPSIPSTERALFQRLKKELSNNSIIDWVSHYKDHRSLWVPYNCSNIAIEEIIKAMIDLQNNNFSERKNSLIKANDFSEDFFGLDEKKQESIWNKLNLIGGVFIIDAISLFHPLLRNTIKDAGVHTNKNISFLIISPINPCGFSPNALIENLIKEQMKMLFLRFEKELDTQCELGVGNERSLQRWLKSALPIAANTIKENAIKENARGIRSKFNYSPKGIQESIYPGK